MSVAPPVTSPFPTTSYAPVVPIIVAAPVSCPPTHFEDSPLLTTYRKPAWYGNFLCDSSFAFDDWAAVIFQILGACASLWSLGTAIQSGEAIRLVTTFWGCIYTAVLVGSVSGAILGFFGMRAKNVPCLMISAALWSVITLTVVIWCTIAIITVIIVPCDPPEICVVKFIALCVLLPLLVSAACVSGPLLYVLWRYSFDVLKHHKIATSVFTIEMQPTAGAPATTGAGAV